MVRALLPAISATWVIGVPASSSLEMNVPRAVYHVIFSSIPRISQTLSSVSLTRDENYVSKEYRNLQTALIREISKYAKAVDVTTVSNSKGHYYTSCFVERNGKLVYISHSSTFFRMGSSVRIELSSSLIRTAKHAKDYTGGRNQYCDLSDLQLMIDYLLNQ